MDSESTMLVFDGKNNLIAVKQVYTYSTGYYNQVAGNAGIFGWQVLMNSIHQKASYILDSLSIII